MWRSLFFLLLLPGITSAQHWRVQMGGGAVTSANFTIERVLFADYTRADNIGNGNAWDGMGAFSILRSDSVWEYGLGVQIMPLHFKNAGEFNESYLGSPAIPITAIVNYGRQRQKSRGYIGANAGIVFSSGRVTENFDQIDLASEYTLYYNSGNGYTLGLQTGYRWNIGAVDLGFQLQLSYTHLSLTHGTNPEKFTFNVISFPIQFCVGYRI